MRGHRYSPLWFGAALVFAAGALHLLGGVHLLSRLRQNPRDAERRHGLRGKHHHVRQSHPTAPPTVAPTPVPPTPARSGHTHRPHKTYPHIRWTPPPTDDMEVGPAWTPDAERPGGYVVFIGNDKYADGALVLGGSVRHHSACVRAGRCRTCAMLAPAVSARAEKLLRNSVMDDVVRVSQADTLSKKTAGTTWGSTFDKFYLYNLTQYSAIAFFDADIVMQRSPDDIFETQLPSDPHWLAATVGHSSKGYFHTGCMVMHPSKTVLSELLGFYKGTLKNATDRYGFRGPNARDGLVMRYFVAGRVVPLGLKYSAQFNHGSRSVVGIHLSGTWKPWFNRWGNKAEVAKVRQELRSPENFGVGHRRWWSEYERIHKKYLCDEAAEEEWREKWGTDTSCKTHVWLMRGTSFEYTQKLGGYV